MVSVGKLFQPGHTFSIQSPPSPPVLFGAKKALYEKYGINPDELTVAGPSGINLPDTRYMLERLLETHEHALKNKALGNLSGRHYSSTILLENGTTGLATNIENSKDVGVLCGERSALVNAWNTALQKLSLKKVVASQNKSPEQNGLKVKMMFMSGSSELGDPMVGNPCAECQSWMSTDRYFSPDTLIATLKKDPETGRFSILVRKLSQLMPFAGKQQPSLTDKAIADLPVRVSEKAADVLSSQGISQPLITRMLEESKQAYLDNRSATASGKDAGAAALFSTGEIVSDARVDWTSRWFEGADMRAAGNGIHALAEKGHPSIAGMAYYGEDSNLPSADSVGRLAQDTWGSQDCLIAVIENDEVQIRTLKDYMTAIYVASKPTPAPSKKTGSGSV